MNIHRRIFGSMLVAAFLLTGAISVFSQEKPSSEGTFVFQREKTPQGPDTVQPRRQSPDENFFVVTSDMSFDGKLVKGAPYSAQGVTEVTQLLADGNRIVKKSTSLIYRDSEGRTRREQTLGAFGPFAIGSEPPQTIFINDPVAGVGYVLDSRAHIARKMPAFQFEWKAAPAPEGMRVPAPPNGPTPGAGQGEKRSGDFLLRTPEPNGEAVVVREYRGEGNRRAKPESLGKQSVEGVEAEGTRETITIPAGEIGNERAIEIINERWYSTELQTVVMTKHTDPRFGETIYRLTNINRGEQPKSLFEVPGDYTVKPGATGIGVRSGGGVAVGTGGGVATGTGSGLAPISGGVLNGKAISLPPPTYPPLAKDAQASGEVSVRITIDEDGNVISAEAVSGHPLLRAAAVSAAREAKFSPTKLSGQPVKVQGVVIYNFAIQ